MVPAGGGHLLGGNSIGGVRGSVVSLGVLPVDAALAGVPHVQGEVHRLRGGGCCSSRMLLKSGSVVYGAKYGSGVVYGAQYGSRG